MGLYRGVELDDLALPGPRLDLRPWLAADARRVFEVLQDESMHGFLTAVPHPYTKHDAADFVAVFAPTARRDATGLESAMVERTSGRLVGAAGLTLGRTPEIGYWVAADSQGRGYAAEAARVLAEWAFSVGVHRVVLHCSVRNVASARSALAAGFAFEGISRGGFVAEAATAATRSGDLARFARLSDDPGDAIAPSFAALPDGCLADDVVLLRTTLPSDAAALAEIDDDPESRRWSLFVEDRDAISKAARRAADRSGLMWAVGDTARMTMVDATTGVAAGLLTLRVGPPQVARIGYAVRPAFRGRGFTARALRLIAPWAFGPAGLVRLELGAKAGNIASQRAALSGGFEPDGVRRARLRNPDSTFSDEPCFALVNPDAGVEPDAGATAEGHASRISP